MNIFIKKKTSLSYEKKFFLYMLIFAVILFLSIIAINHLDNFDNEKRLSATRDIIFRSVIHCYAVEGFYPPNISYLEDNYGLQIDDQHFTVDYQYLGDNLLPDITVLFKGR